MSDFLDTVPPARVEYCYEDGNPQLVARDYHESQMLDAQCRAEHAARVHAAEMHEMEMRLRALDAENAELRRQLNVAAHTLTLAGEALDAAAKRAEESRG